MKTSVEKLFNLVKLVEQEFDLNIFLKELLRNLNEIFNVEFLVILLTDPTYTELHYRISLRTQEKYFYEYPADFTKVKIGEALVGACAIKLAQQSFSKSDLSEDTKTFYKKYLALEINNSICTPVISRGKLFGVLELVNKKDNSDFSEDDKKLLYVYANYAAIQIHNVNLINEIDQKERLSKLGQSIINSAHGLKNILNNLDGGAFIAEKGASSKNFMEVDKGWDIIKRNSHRLRELVLDILLYSRPKQIELKKSDINQVCDDLKELLGDTVRESNVEIVFFLDRSIKEFCFDQKGIHRCLLNIISNAIHACSQKGGGRVNITTKLNESKQLEIVIADNGIGISKENLEYIYDVFFTTKGSKGTGLGLPVTKKIIEEHNGTIEVSSTLNIGTKFIITLPRKDC